MKARKLKKLLQGIALGACLSPWTVIYAAQQEMLWGKVTDYTALLRNFTLNQPSTTPKDLRLPADMSTRKGTVNTVQFLSGQVDSKQTSHARYDQYYQGIPVWSSQVIYHVKTSSDTAVTGSLVTGIEQDVPNLTGKFSLEQAKKIAIGKNSVKANVNTETVIYFDQDVSAKAVLAYHISYLTNTANGPAIPSYIIDANSGKVLQQWNALTRALIGQGRGGVTVDRLTYRPGSFQYGSTVMGLFGLGMLQVENNQGSCTFSNSQFSVINLQNLTEQQLRPIRLPVSNVNEKRYPLLKPFSYSCAAPLYANTNDGGYAPINDGNSPVNDAAYFVQQTFNMLITQYKVASPIGSQLPVRVFTHLGNYDNAFACGPSCLRQSGVVGPQQLVFGNGGQDFSPLTDGDGVAHEFGHLVTEHFSNLKYNNQSGGMNEAFSDMTGVAVLDYLRNTLGYTWFWDGKDWTTGASVSKNGKPLRYYDNPPADGQSIDNVSHYTRGMDTHLSSGIYNKAYYLLSTTVGWTPAKAYQVMLDANMNYWTAGATFKSGGCGVLQAARGRGYPEQDVKVAFQTVGINLTNCKKI